MKYQELAGHYAIEKTIGCGGFAKVKVATHCLTGEKVAIKIMQKDLLKEDLPRVKQEIEALKSLSHPHICKLYEVIESETHYFLVMEYCCGGELFDHIVETQRLSEEKSRKFFRQIVSAVSYLHEQGYAHRDLKPENILLDKNQSLKLIDFGLCIKPKKGIASHLYTSCGSPSYAAPELILGEKYLGSQVDIWSLGVMLYALLCGTLPFDDNNIETLYKKIIAGDYEEPSWLSKESKALMKQLLQIEACHRITTDELCVHPWLVKGHRKGVEKLGGEVDMQRNEQCLGLVARHLKKPAHVVWAQLESRNYDSTMATYMLLLQRASAGLPLRLIHYQNRKLSCENCDNTNSPILQRNGEATYSVLRRREVPTTKQFPEPRQKRTVKRTRSPGLTEVESVQSASKRVNRTPTMSPMGVARSSKRTSRTPNVPSDTTSTPSSARKVLEGLERGFNIARRVLTPRRHSKRNVDVAEPAVLTSKELYNVSSTCSSQPDEILDQLRAALAARGIVCTQKGYTLRGKLKQAASPGKDNQASYKLSFELEVCWLPGWRASSAVVGIRRKRLKGDAWIYKNVVEQILTLSS